MSFLKILQPKGFELLQKKVVVGCASGFFHQNSRVERKDTLRLLKLIKIRATKLYLYPQFGRLLTLSFNL